MFESYQSHKWLVTINEPEKCPHIDEAISLINPDYCCIVKHKKDEDNTYHIHILFYLDVPTTYIPFMACFETANVYRINENLQQCIDYITKEGKWKDTDKMEVVIEGSFIEYGTKPIKEKENE